MRLDPGRLRERKILAGQRLLEQYIIDTEGNLSAFNSYEVSRMLLEEMERLEVEEFERWHEVECNSPQEGFEE